MKYILVISDLLFNWSDNEKQIPSILKKKKKLSYQKINLIGEYGNSWILNRKIQTLWKTSLQVPSRSGSRTKVLSFYKSTGKLSKDEIYSSERKRNNSRLYSKLFECSKIIGRDQRNQFRAFSKTEIIKVRNENKILQSLHNSDCDCKYVARLFNSGGG
jgi:hypothetical protein